MATLPLVRAFGLQALILLFLLNTGPVTAREADREGLQIYLDAAHQAVTLQLPASAPRNGLQLSMLDATGHIIYRKPFNADSGPLVSLPVGGYAAGTYLLIVEGPGGYNVAQRLVLK
jgi:hypothetical protein